MPKAALKQRLGRARGHHLRIQARTLAQGMHSGAHRAERRGSGVEFAGHREYMPGDDLRHLDRHALLRHGKLLIRQFHTDTERPVHLIVDVTRSMHYKSARRAKVESDSGETKVSRALLLAATMGFVAHLSGDAIGLTFVSDTDNATTLLPRGGKPAFEQILALLTEMDESQSASNAQVTRAPWEATFDLLGTRLKRGTVILVLSDFLDFDRERSRRLAALCTRGRTVRAVQVLTRDEVDFPFDGALSLLDPETHKQVETNAGAVRLMYQERLEALTSEVHNQLTRQGGAFARSLTDAREEETLLFLAGDQRRGAK